ncbi:2-dehydropantoate 2-reductase [Litorivivens lipolytica]|uniref:2-dehydropantoate 2-reductase n=1 Tax=Litorivivens lipolytica TaxID=1524264 RepID=A0A7W4Z7M1_9GAMM|nr:2-dehydropantoate 2-reductase [Litorivivens lipolytica]MBB3048046.1 2-dehydropantoate 2-reductase [Litorivivens lipolytica]
MAEQWLILGAGSIGGLWAARLHQALRAPTLLLKEDAFADYRGLTIDGEGIVPVAAATPSQLNRPIDRLLVCCKSYQTLDALSPLAPYFHNETSLVLVQNGLGIAEEIKALYPRIKLYCGTTTAGANRLDRFTIRPAGEGETLIGAFDGSVRELKTIADSLSCEAFPVAASDTIQALLWRKLAINCAINPLTVRYRCHNGELLDIEAAREDMAAICSEFTEVSEALGRADWVPNLLATVTQVAEQTGNNRSSMLQDVEAGQRTEIEAITGYLCREAKRLAIPTPVNESLFQEVVSTHSPH